MALAAALFVARRYHQKAGKRKEENEAEVGYPYNPSSGGGSDDGDAEKARGGPVMPDDSGPFMSGGAGPAPTPAPASASAPALPAPAMTGSTNGAEGPAVNATVLNRTMSKKSFRHSLAMGSTSRDALPRESRYSTGNIHLPHSFDSDMPMPPMNRAAMEYADLLHNPFSDPIVPPTNPAANAYPPMSPYGAPPMRIPSPVQNRESRYSDPFADPFEHDLLLNVDMKTATSDSIVVLAPPPTSHDRFPDRESNSSVIPGRMAPDGRYTPDHHAPSGRGTPEGSFNPYGGFGQPMTTSAKDSIVPAPLSMARKPVPANAQTRREPTLAGPGQMLLSSGGLPLTIKKKPLGSGAESGQLEVPKDMYASPGTDATDFSDDAGVQRKRSGELLFADPHLIGQKF